MFQSSTQHLRERLRGFEAELTELQEALQVQVDEKTVRELERLLPEALAIFHGRMDAAAYERLVHLVVGLKLDPEQIIPLLSARVFEHGECHGHGLIEHMLRAQNAADPSRRARLQEARRVALERRWQEVFRAVGLDGVALQKLLLMKPGREFGNHLRTIQAWVKGEGEMPQVEGESLKELISRKNEARVRMGVKNV